MIRRMKNLVHFLFSTAQEWMMRVRTHGWRSGIAFLQCRWGDFYNRQARKIIRTPQVECPVCGWQGYDFLMLDCGNFSVPHVECLSCRSHERHRLLHVYLTRVHPELLDGVLSVLHFAPESHVRQILDQRPGVRTYSTDYAPWMLAPYTGTAFRADLMHMPIPDASFDRIFCLHVLEHVPDDRVGIHELHRMLKPGGKAFIMVPFMMGWESSVEFDEPDVQQFYHVRGYSPNDFHTRLEPFAYEAVTPRSFLSESELRRYRIPHDSQVLFLCTKS